LAFTPFFGSEQLLYWSFCLFAHHSSKKSPLVPTDLIQKANAQSPLICAKSKGRQPTSQLGVRAY
jgi:hypothetical protein